MLVEVYHVMSNPLARGLAGIRKMHLGPGLPHIAGINKHGSAVRHFDECGLALTGRDGMKVEISGFPVRKIGLGVESGRKKGGQQDECDKSAHMVFD